MQLGPIMRIDIATAPARQHGPTTAAAAATPGSASKQGRPGSGRSAASRGAAGAAGSGNCRRSVTSLLFVRNEHTMISSSDMDGVVKLWDLRRLSAATGDITLPPRGSPAAAVAGVGRKSSGSGRSRSGGGRKGSAAGGADGVDAAGDACWMGFSCPSRSSRPAGISSMALSPAGAHMCDGSCELQQTAWAWQLACVQLYIVSMLRCSCHNLCSRIACAECSQVRICRWL
jgi:hypothetical protein